MNRLRESLLELYQAATARSRQQALRRLCAAGRAPVSVLFYHRVADTHPNGWTLSSKAFERQINWLRDRFDVVSLAEAQARLAEGANHRPAVAITFDDGYGENCETAIPFLLGKRLPFTYFVSTKIVRDQSAFPHDLEAGQRLRPNTISELRSMADAGVEIGAHTRTHADMGQSTDPDWLSDEIIGSMDDLESWTGRRPWYFAFPYGQTGNFTPAAMRLCQQAGLAGVCSAYGAYNRPERTSPEHGAFHLRRIHADPEWARFANWMTFDERKLNQADPIDDPVYLNAGLTPPAGANHA